MFPENRREACRGRALQIGLAPEPGRAREMILVLSSTIFNTPVRRGEARPATLPPLEVSMKRIELVEEGVAHGDDVAFS